MSFYAFFVRLCNAKGVSPSEAGQAIGGSRAMVNGWKSGKSLPTDARIFKLAEYFNVPEDEFFKCEDLAGRNNVPVQKESPTITAGQVKQFLFGSENVPDEMLAEVKWYAGALLRKEWDYRSL